MTILAVYFIYEDGRVMLSEIFQSKSSAPNAWMMSGLLVTFRNMAYELTKHQAEILHLGNLFYHIGDYGSFILVLVSTEEERPEKILETLGPRFMSKYGIDLVSWNGLETTFQPFKETVLDIIKKYSKVDLTASVNPVKSLTSDEIFLLPKQHRKVALLFLNSNDLSILEIMEESGSLSKDEIEESLKFLLTAGLLGLRLIINEVKYFKLD